VSKKYAASEALRITAKNEYRVWAGRGDPATAMARFNSGKRMTIEHKPKFSISREDTIFTIGSCFAREIEGTLGVLGIPFSLRGHGIEPEHFESWDEETQTGGGAKKGSLSRGAFNKYCVHAMTHELKRVLLGQKHENEGLIELKEDQWFDPHASGLKVLPHDVAIKNREALRDGILTVKKAQAVFITLGMTESWLDKNTGMVMNQNPGAAFLRKFGDRFEFIDYSFSEVLKEMHDLIALVRHQCNPEMKFVVTVSPVPLGTTFQESDIIVSNSHSKSLLRAVAEEIKRTYDYVDYFPSYEIVMNSPRDLAWREDYLHVQWPMVQHVMQNFKQAFCPEIPVTLAAE
jgi:hypothetical protein